FSLMLRQPSMSTRFPYTTLFRSQGNFAFPLNPASTHKQNQGRSPRQCVVMRPNGYDVAIEPIHPQISKRRRKHLALANCGLAGLDRKSTRLNSSHVKISYAVFCL